MMKKVVALIIMFVLTAGMNVFADDIDYAAIYGDFLTNRLEAFYNEHKAEIEYSDGGDFSDYKDSYIIDLYNDGSPELVNIFCGYNWPHTMVVEYDGEFKLAKQLEFGCNIGTGGSVYHEILRKNGKIYIHDYSSARLEYAGDSPTGTNRWSVDDKISLYEDESEEMVYHFYSEDGISHYLNGSYISAEEIDYGWPIKKEYETLLSSRDFGDSIYGTENKYKYGKEYLKFWNENQIIMQINNPVMNINGTAAAIDEGIGTTPILKDGRTLMPIRALIESIGGTVEWDESSSTVTLLYKENEIKLIIGSLTAYLNGIPKTLDVAPSVINGRTMLPIRFISEGFGFSVVWDSETQTIVISY